MCELILEEKNSKMRKKKENNIWGWAFVQRWMGDKRYVEIVKGLDYAVLSYAHTEYMFFTLFFVSLWTGGVLSFFI